jgi:hypothetical protein
LNNLDFALPKDDLNQVQLKLASLFWRTRSLKMFRVFVLFCYYLPLEKGNPVHLNNLEFPPPRTISSKSCKNLPSGSREEVENVKVYRQTDRITTDNGRSE